MGILLTEETMSQMISDALQKLIDQAGLFLVVLGAAVLLLGFSGGVTTTTGFRFQMTSEDMARLVWVLFCLLRDWSC
jgi:hypothetical protein